MYIFKTLALLFLSGICYQTYGQKYIDQTQVNIIPAPLSLDVKKGNFLLDPNIAIVIGGSYNEVVSVGTLLSGRIQQATGYNIKIVRQAAKTSKAIFLTVNSTNDASMGTEGYTMSVEPAKITIRANKPAGLFYGVQSLMQLLPPEIESTSVVKDKKWSIQCVDITDNPRFKWRGLMLDVSRHFFSKEFVKRYIDEMVKYKFNVFHWHLSDDHGWRVEIKGLPELTSVGAWRVPRTGKRGTFDPAEPGETATYGGYYTQDEIREIVKYAEERHVTILPEIDVPGHSLSLISAYPNVSCTGEHYNVNPLTKFKREDNVVCVANDSTWKLLEIIYTQIAQLFPGKYIHTGGDEAYKGYWKECPKDQALMKSKGIKTPEELQSHFEKRLEQLIMSKGKRMIGWDEILEGGLAPEATVMSWRGTEGGIKAAKMGHDVIMSSQYDAYLDLYQGDPIVEPFTYGYCRMKTCYEFEPVAAGVDPKYILGGQANLWTEAVPTERHAEYMTWPRALAISEVYWSPKEKRNWPDFAKRMEWRLNYLDAAKVKYARSAFDPVITATKGPGDTLLVKLESEIPDLDLYYTFTTTDPDNYYPKYNGQPLLPPKEASEIRVITYRDGKPIGKQINFSLNNLKHRLPAPRPSAVE
jgi:hexosaminidase